MSSYGYSNRGQRTGGSGSYSNDKHRSFHRNVNTLTRLGGSSSGGAVVPSNVQSSVGRNVPKPIQTCSLKKENGGQDITAVLVNRNNGSGKRIGWGSALPATNSTPTERTETNDNKQPKEQRPKEQQQYPPLPPTANVDSDGKNVPWAMHPPAKVNDEAIDDAKRGVSPPQHQQEKGERSYPPERYYHPPPPPHYHRDYAPHDRRYRSHPGVPPPYVDDQPPRYRDDDQPPPPRYYSNDRYYRRNDYHAPRPYSRDRNDYRPRYDPRPPPEYMHRDDRPRNPDKESQPSAQSFDARNHVPNSYYESKDLRWGDEEDDDSVKHDENVNENQGEPHSNEHPPHDNYDHRYAYRDAPNRQRYMPDKMERDYRSRYDMHHYNHYPRNYSNYRRSYEPQQRLNYEYHPDDRRTQDGYHIPPNYHRPFNPHHAPTQQPPPHNEDEVVMQAIREREAAEARAKQKDMERFRYDKKTVNQTSENQSAAPVVPSGPIVILRNKQTSGEASSDLANSSEQQIALDEKVEDKQNVEVCEETEKSCNDVQNTDTEITTDEQHAAKDISNEENIPKITEKPSTYATITSKPSQNIPEQPNESKSNEKLENDVDVSVGSEENVKPLPPVSMNAQERKAFEQQNVLRRVAAYRESTKKKSKGITKKNSKSSRDNSLEEVQHSSSKEESVNEEEVQETIDDTKENDVVMSLPKWGPRTKGVLFRRLPDGTLVNADLSEEEIARREERRKAKLERELAKEEKRKERLKAKEEKLKAKEARKQQLKESKRKDKDEVKQNGKQEEKAASDGEAKPDKAVPKNTNHKSQPFVPAPPPAISAWEAGPPRSVIAASIPVPTEVPLKSSNDTDIEDITDSEVEETSGPANIDAKNKIPFKADKPIDEANWSQSKENTNEKQINISSINHIGLPTWNTFGVFAPPQENGSAHANSSWALRNESDGMVTKPISWTDASCPHPTNEEDDAALTDASAAVPRDLLSSGPASEEEETGKEDVNDKINKEKSHQKRNKPYQRKPRPGRHTRPRKSHKSYQRKQSREQANDDSVTADSKQEVDKSRHRPRNYKRRYYNKDNRRSNHSSMDRSSKDDDAENRECTRRPYRPRSRKPKRQNTPAQPPVEATQ